MDQIFLETPFGFSIELSGLGAILSSSPIIWFLAIFAVVGWVVFSIALFKKAAEKLVDFRRKKKQDWKWVVLAVDVPALFIQSPKAVEQIFTQLSGALISPNIIEKYWYGRQQKTFSFEVISIEGYIQFLIRTEMEFRDLVEAAIYAQYAEAEIAEVEDYVDHIPNHYPSSEYDVFGVEFKLAENDAYPIRTYPSFEHNISKEQIFSDPMAGILENFSRTARGENLWLQMIVQPVSNSWKEAGIELVQEIIEAKGHKHETNILVKILGLPISFLQLILTEITKGGGDGHDKKGGDSHKKDEKPKGMSDLTPGKRATVEAIEEKIAKIGFKAKLQVLYVARKENFFPNRCVDGLVGAMNQFHILSRNAIVPSLVTAVAYDKSGKKTNHMKSEFVERYKKRKMKGKHKSKKGGHGKHGGHAGGHHPADPYILNIEELATIWHFPLPNVRTPLVQKAGAKRGEPPLGLPVEMSEGPLRKKTVPIPPTVVKPTPPPTSHEPPTKPFIYA
jgi:hypothetical protein